MSLLLVEIDAATDDQGTVETFRFATEGYNHPSAPGYYAERIRDTVDIRRQIRGADGTGQASVGFSDLVIGNADGDLDNFVFWGFDGREIRGLVLDDVDQDYANAERLFTATMGVPEFTLVTVTIPIKDRLGELDQPLHRKDYAGTNSLPDGLEGTPDDIQGSPKPEPEGFAFNAQPPLVNTSRLIYEFAAGDRECDVGFTYEGGAVITRGSDYTSQQDMEDNPPNSGQVRVWPRQPDGSGGLEGGYLRLGSSPTLPITCDVEAGASSSERTTARVLEALALRAPTIDSGDISAADVSDLESVLPEQIGVWEPREATILRTMETIAQGTGTWFGFDQNGVLRMGLWEAPSGATDAIFKQPDAAAGNVLASDEFNLVDVESQGSREEDRPVSKVIVRYRRNRSASVQLASSVPDDKRAEFESEWRRENAADSTVENRHANARQLEIDSPWDTSAGASDMASRTLNRDKEQRRRWRFSASLDRGLAQQIDLASTVELGLQRLDFFEGKQYRVRQIEVDPVAGRVQYLIWG